MFTMKRDAGDGLVEEWRWGMRIAPATVGMTGSNLTYLVEVEECVGFVDFAHLLVESLCLRMVLQRQGQSQRTGDDGEWR